VLPYSKSLHNAIEWSDSAMRKPPNLPPGRPVFCCVNPFQFRIPPRLIPVSEMPALCDSINKITCRRDDIVVVTASVLGI
jgi:hypothetical protein